MGRRTSAGFLGRLGIPLLSSLLLLAAGLAFLLLPVEVDHRSCGGNAVAVRLQAEGPTHHDHECHAKALVDLLFGSTVAAAGLGLALFSAALLGTTSSG